MHTESQGMRTLGILYILAATTLTLTAKLSKAEDREICLSQLIPAIDIGHTLLSPGARDVFGRPEVLYNADLAGRLVVSFTNLGFRRTIVVNKTLNIEGLQSRPQKAVCGGADVFISIHHDNVSEVKKVHATVDGKQLLFNDEIGGYTIYFSSKSAMSGRSRNLAKFVSEYLMEAGIPSASGHQNYIADGRRSLVDDKLNVWDYRDLAVCRYSIIPAILIEAGFLSNREDVARLRDVGFQDIVAAAIAKGVLAACMSDPQIIAIAQLKLERIEQCR
jgi:N-acetylmuramoyl-L-alanine amidase